MLEGNLVRLRAVEPGDLERNYQWVNDREVARNLVLRYPLSHADERAFVEDRSANSYANTILAIETKDGVHIGNCGLHEAQPENRRASLGIMIGDKDYWSKGYGTDAVDHAAALRLRRDEPQPRLAPRLRVQRARDRLLQEVRLRRGGHAAPELLRRGPLLGHDHHGRPAFGVRSAPRSGGRADATQVLRSRPVRRHGAGRARRRRLLR